VNRLEYLHATLIGGKTCLPFKREKQKTVESDIESWSELKDIQQKRPPSLKNKKQADGRKIRNPKQEKTTLTG